MFFYLPNVIMNNIHSLMIFCKKILELSVENMFSLKIICLKILNRLYSRHTGVNVGYKYIKFA
jgi:hypothetical protein